MNDSSDTEDLCPCGSEQDYAQCCGVYHQAEALPPTAEKLMRSRYSAFVKNNFDYLNTTLHATADQYDTPENRKIYSQFEWQGLEILATDKGTETDTDGYVEFVARYRLGGGDHTIREKSFFVKENGKWLYKDGKSLQATEKSAPKTGRNEPCPCGSGKKYKKCCMN